MRFLKSLIPKFLMVCLLVSCLSEDQGEKFSFNDPFFLTINEKLVTCEINPVSNLTNFNNALDSFYVKFKSQNQINYRSIVSSKSERESLCNLVGGFKNVSYKSLENDEKAAFLANAHDVMSMWLVVANFNSLTQENNELTKRSIKNIDNKQDRVWIDFKFDFGEEFLSFRQIEQKLTKLIGPEIHFILSKASRGSLAIYQTAHRKENILERLKETTLTFVNEESFIIPEDNFIDTFDIFEQYKADFFGNTNTSTIDTLQFFSTYLDEESNFPVTKQELLKKTIDEDTGEAVPVWNVEYSIYDFSLNE